VLWGRHAAADGLAASPLLVEGKTVFVYKGGSGTITKWLAIHTNQVNLIIRGETVDVMRLAAALVMPLAMPVGGRCIGKMCADGPPGHCNLCAYIGVARCC
jgi:hypothetical protein